MLAKNKFYKRTAWNATSWEYKEHKKITEVAFGVNFARLWMQSSVTPTEDADWLQELWLYTPIDYIMEKYGILRSDLMKQKSYLGKWIKDEDDIQAIDEYFAFQLWTLEEWEFTDYLAKKDYDPVPQQSREDIELAKSMKKEEEKRKRDEELISKQNSGDVMQAVMDQNKMLMWILQSNGLLPQTITDGKDSQKAKNQATELQDIEEFDKEHNKETKEKATKRVAANGSTKTRNRSKKANQEGWGDKPWLDWDQQWGTSDSIPSVLENSKDKSVTKNARVRNKKENAKTWS